MRPRTPLACMPGMPRVTRCNLDLLQTQSEVWLWGVNSVQTLCTAIVEPPASRLSNLQWLFAPQASAPASGYTKRVRNSLPPNAWLAWLPCNVVMLLSWCSVYYIK